MSRHSQLLLRRNAAVALAVLVLFSAGVARADDIYTITVKKQEEKQKTRWSLSDWLETKEKIRLMDMWLAMHSPSPFEFYLGADSRSGTSSGVTTNGVSASMAAYASIFGLAGEYENLSAARYAAHFNLRVFGYHDQSTNITLVGGTRVVKDFGPDESQTLFGGKMDLCLSRYFGLEGVFFRYLPSADFVSPAGSRTELGAFIDYSFLRVYGTYFTESSPFDRTGFSIGTKLYF